MNLLDVVQRDTGRRFHLNARTKGGEYVGPCPLCREGDDRFHVWPNHPSGKAHWWCRMCEERGDLADYLQKVHGMTVKDSLQAAGLSSSSSRHKPLHKVSVPHRSPTPPNATWQSRARAFVSYSQAQLWGADGFPAREYLRCERGLSEETIRHFGLGYNPGAWYQEATIWGLAESGKVYLSPGIVIPCSVGDALWYVQVRRPCESDPLAAYIDHIVEFRPTVKYWAVKGGQGKALFGLNELRTDKDVLLFCEGEFDAMLAWQELRQAVDVVTLGGASKGSDGVPLRWSLHLIPYRQILVAYDVDENRAGDKGAAQLLAQSQRAVRVAVPWGGDLTGFWRSGGDLQAWLTIVLAEASLEVPA